MCRDARLNCFADNAGEILPPRISKGLHDFSGKPEFRAFSVCISGLSKFIEFSRKYGYVGICHVHLEENGDNKPNRKEKGSLSKLVLISHVN